MVPSFIVQFPNMIFGLIVFEQMCSNKRAKWVLRGEEAYSGNINIPLQINLIIITIITSLHQIRIKKLLPVIPTLLTCCKSKVRHWLI